MPILLRLLVLAGLYCTPLFSAAEPYQISAAEPYQIPRTHVHALQSSINEKHYEVYVYTPRGYSEGQKHYPMVVLNDSAFAFPLAVGAGRLLMVKDMQEAILVGISYSQGDAPGTSRTRDYTPTFAPDETSYHSIEAKQVSGQAHDYIAFIEQDLLPFLEKNYRVDMQNKVLVGHSFGGLLGAYTLLVNPTLFEHYVLGSPSLWYDNKAIFRLEAEYAKTHKSMPANVYMYVGDSEDNPVHSMVRDARAYQAQLLSRNYQGLTLNVSLIKDGTHHNAFPLLLTRALPAIFPRQK